MEPPDFYSILDVSPGASREEIARAYRRKARQCHPDLQPADKADWAEQRMKDLNAAYEVLADDARRADYDRWRRRRSTDVSLRGARASTRRGGRPIRLRAILTHSLDIVTGAYLILGGVLIATFAWPLLQTYNSIFTHPYHWLAVVVWFVLLGRALFRILPFWRLK